jgi:hypothetical protein
MAAQRSTAHAAALARSYASRRNGSPDGAVSEVVSRSFEYLMSVNVGTPATRLLAIADTDSDLVWIKCTNGTTMGPPQSLQFDPSSSSTFGRVGYASGACHTLSDTSCDASLNCKYLFSYEDGSSASGLLSTETFTFDDHPGGCIGCHDIPQLRVPNVNFGCSMATTGSFLGDGLVGLGDRKVSLINQLGADNSLGRRFSYCLVTYSVNASSVLNFSDRAMVTEPGVATTPLIPSEVDAYLTVSLESVRIGNTSTVMLPHRSSLIVDSGTTLAILGKVLLDQVVEELTQSMKLPRAQSPDKQLPLCYDVAGVSEALEKIVPDVKLGLGGGGVVTLKAENTFVKVEDGKICMALAVVSEEFPDAILGNVEQQNMHLGFDLDKRTITFAAADCGKGGDTFPWISASEGDGPLLSACHSCGRREGEIVALFWLSI